MISIPMLISVSAPLGIAITCLLYVLADNKQIIKQPRPEVYVFFDVSPMADNNSRSDRAGGVHWIRCLFLPGSKKKCALEKKG